MGFAIEEKVLSRLYFNSGLIIHYHIVANINLYFDVMVITKKIITFKFCKWQNINNMYNFYFRSP